MPRHIDVDALKKDIRENYIIYGYEDFISDFFRCLDEQPTVEAEPVRHGHWTEKRNPMMYQLLPYVWVCDQCGTAFYYKTPYCGECGAKMDEEEK